MRYLRYSLLSAFLTVLALPVGTGMLQSDSLYAQSASGKEYTLKAAFIYNFTRYMQWDAESTGGDFLIGIIGDSEIQQPLEDIAQKRKVGNRSIKIVRFEPEDIIPSCHILFSPEKQTEMLQPILTMLKTQPSLIVTESPNKAKEGAAVNFVNVDGKIRFEINETALERAGITASSKLKNIAIMVNEL